MIGKEAHQIAFFFEELEIFIRAIVTDAGSDHVEDSVRLTEIRKELIDRAVSGEFR